MHDYKDQFNLKWKKNQFGGREVVGQTTVLAHLTQEVGRRLPMVMMFFFSGTISPFVIPK